MHAPVVVEGLALLAVASVLVHDALWAVLERVVTAGVAVSSELLRTM